MTRPHYRKSLLLSVIEAAYKHGYGPRAIGQMTDYSYKTIQGYATDLGLSIGTTIPKPPPEPPAELLHALFLYRHS